MVAKVDTKWEWRVEWDVDPTRLGRRYDQRRYDDARPPTPRRRIASARCTGGRDVLCVCIRLTDRGTCLDY